MKTEFCSAEIIDLVEARNKKHLNQKRLEVNIETYQNYLDKCDLPAEKRGEFANALWTIIVAFVDLGYGVHPVQSGDAKIVNFSSPHQKKQEPVDALGGISHAK